MSNRARLRGTGGPDGCACQGRFADWRRCTDGKEAAAAPRQPGRPYHAEESTRKQSLVPVFRRREPLSHGAVLLAITLFIASKVVKIALSCAYAAFGPPAAAKSRQSDPYH